ncbi:MAG: hypothetical protein IT460_17210 [Planctomycetes bacterium]|nr:hypothetical protein [Planctomycetota bacterium]
MRTWLARPGLLLAAAAAATGCAAPSSHASTSPGRGRTSPAAPLVPVAPPAPTATAVRPLAVAPTAPTPHRAAAPAVPAAPVAGPPSAGPAPAGPRAPAAPPPPARPSDPLDALRAAARGGDADFAAVADLLEDALERLATADATTHIERLPAREAQARATVGRGTAWATATTYVEADADADALREAYLDFDRVPVYTGKPGTRTVERRGDVVVAAVDGVRRILALEVGARWRFEARRVDRGTVRAIVTRQVDDPTTWKMTTTKGLVLFVPVGASVRVVEVALSVVDFEVPPLLRGVAEKTALGEMRARVDGVRAHWREYLPAQRGARATR